MQKILRNKERISKNKINQQLFFLKTAKNGPLCEVKFTKPEASCRIFLAGMRMSGLNNIPVKFGRQTMVGRCWIKDLSEGI